MSDLPNPEDLDPGIREVVMFLRSEAYDTTDSGDGRTKFANGPDDCARTEPHVTIRVDPDFLIWGCDQVRISLMREGAEVVPLGPDEPAMGEAVIEGVYLPASNVALIEVTHFDDADLAFARARKRPPA